MGFEHFPALQKSKAHHKMVFTRGRCCVDARCALNRCSSGLRRAKSGPWKGNRTQYIDDGALRRVEISMIRYYAFNSGNLRIVVQEVAIVAARE